MSNLATYLLNAEECYILNQRVLKILKEELPEEISVNKVRPFLEQLDTNLAALLAKANSAEITAMLNEADAARDRAFIGFRDFCAAFTNIPDPVKSEAAKKLTALIRKLGWSLQSEGYTEQTAAMKTLIESLETPEYAKAVLTIEATYWVNNMKTANAEFERVTELKNEIVSQTNTPLLSECKGAMIRYLKPLLIYINLMADVEPAAYSTANAKISEAVESITTVARSRQTRKENQQEDDEA